MYTFKDELNFFYKRFLSNEKDFSTLKNWAKPILYPFWIVRCIIMSILIVLLFPLFDLYFFYHEDITNNYNEFSEKFQKDMIDIETLFQQLKK